jgi:SAM-dependent methyltransferase
MKTLEDRLLAVATEPYRQAGRFAHGFAKGKLSGDPAFVQILKRGWIKPHSRVVDIGCGQGLLSALLMATQELHQQGQWPGDWPAAPTHVKVTGIELMASDVQRAREALSAHRAQFDFVVGDMRSAEFGKADHVVILDVLHYVPYEDQNEVLQRVKASLAPAGSLILRIGDAAGGFGFTFSNWVDNVVMFARGHRLPRLYCRSVAQWKEQLESLGFRVTVLPMSEGTMFSNVTLYSELVA